MELKNNKYLLINKINYQLLIIDKDIKDMSNKKFKNNKRNYFYTYSCPKIAIINYYHYQVINANLLIVSVSLNILVC